MKGNKGFVHLIIIVLVAIIALSYFGIDLEQVFAKPLFQKNLSFTWHIVTDAWTTYVYDPITGLFHKNGSEQILLNDTGSGGNIEK